MTSKRLSITVLIVTTLYAVVTLVISSFIIAGIQERASALTDEAASIQRKLDTDHLAFEKSRAEVRDAIFMVSNSMMMGVVAMQSSNSSDSLQSALQAMTINTATAGAFWARGLDSLHELVRDVYSVSERNQEFDAIVDAAQAGNLDPVAAMSAAEFLMGVYGAEVERQAFHRDELRAAKEQLDQRESMVKSIALALQFMMILALFAKDYYMERRKVDQVAPSPFARAAT